MKTIGKESNDYKEFKKWYKHINSMLYTLREVHLLGLKEELTNLAEDVSINDELEEIKGLVKIKKMLIKIDGILIAKQSLNN